MKKNKQKDFEIKFDDFEEEEEDQGICSALLSKYNHIDSYGDVVMKGAYTNTMAKRPKIPLLADHDSTKQCGVAELFDTEEGLKIKMTFFLNTELGKEKFQLTKATSNAGLPMGTSIGYKVVKRSFDEMGNQQVRRLEEIDLYEASITPFPACQPCLVDSVKSEEDINVRDIEHNLRDAGLSISQSKKYASLIKKDLCDEESEEKEDETEEVEIKEIDTAVTIEVIDEVIDEEVKEDGSAVLLSEFKKFIQKENLKLMMETL